MFSMFSNLAKAAVAVVVTPVALVVDVVSLPSTSESGKPAFGKTSAMLSAAGAAISEALEPARK